MATVIQQESDLPERVARAVASHMGPWYSGPEPDLESPLEDLLHTADMIASTANITPKVPTPVPKELEEIGVEGQEQ